MILALYIAQVEVVRGPRGGCCWGMGSPRIRGDVDSIFIRMYVFSGPVLEAEV